MPSSAVPDICALWDRTEHIAGTPAESYLYGRLGRIDLAGIPGYSLRWLPAESAPCWKNSDTSICPAGSAGLLVAGYYPTCDRYLHRGCWISPPQAVELEALRPCGRRPRGDRRWRRTFGSRREAAAEVWCHEGGERGTVALAEGIITALAAAQKYCGRHGQALAAGSADNLPHLRLPPHRDYVLVADGDAAGRVAAGRMLLSLPDLKVHHSPDGKDAADGI